ncbi:MAG TPA: 3'-5' exonuclease [bacterium]|jgi:ribosomal protein S18
MAEMIPESISASASATKGEKHLFHILREALQPDDDFIVWYDLTVGSKHPDFIVYGQYLGLLIIEVKDWTLRQIKEANPDKFLVDLSGNIQKCDSPLTQARKAYRELMDKVKKYPSLLHPDGNHKGQPRFPIGYCAVFSEITRDAAVKAGITEALPPLQCLFADEISFDPTEKSQQQAFIQRLKPSFNITVQFKGEPLEQKDLKILRHAIFPEVRINDVRTTGAPSASVDLRTLDYDQERVAKSIGSGHRILKGVAGSGKTLVVAARAKYLKQCHPDWRILLVCYNTSLSKYLRKLVEVTGGLSDVSNIDVFHFTGLVKSVVNTDLRRAWDEPFDKWEERITGYLEEVSSLGLASAHTDDDRNIGRYDAILIDEGQDFTVGMVRSLVSLLNEETDSLLFCYDPSQNVFGRETPRWKDAGLKVQGKRPIELNTSYRSTSEIIDLASKFSKIPAQQAISLEAVLVPKSVNRHGARPVMRQLADETELCKYIMDEIHRYVRTGACAWSDIGILYANKYEEFPMAFNAAFYKRFNFEETDRLYWVNQNDESRHNMDVTSPCAKMCTIESSKGLEFKVVFFVGLDTMPRNNRNVETERRLAYVAMTRAQEYLHIPYVRLSPFVDEIRQLL